MLTYDELLESPAVRNFARNLPPVGLHKIAGTLYGVGEIDLDTAIKLIGTKLAHDLHRQRVLARGLASYDTVTKEANFLSSLVGKAKTLGKSAVPAAEQVTHMMPTAQGSMALMQRGAIDKLPGALKGHAVEIPAYARQVSEGGTFVPKMPASAPPQATAPAAEGVKTKSRPTQAMGAPELPSMFRSGTLERGGQMGSGGTGILAGGGAAPTGVGSFGAPQSSAEAPAMFNLKDLMGKQAALSPEQLNTYVRRGIPVASGLALGGLNAAEEHRPAEVSAAEAFARPAFNVGAGGLLGMEAGRALGGRLGGPVGRVIGTGLGAAAGPLAMGTLTNAISPMGPEYERWLEAAQATDEEDLAKQANINLAQLLAQRAPAAASGYSRNAAAFKPQAAVAPKLQQAMQGAVAPSPFANPMRAVPSAEEMAMFAGKQASDAAVLRNAPMIPQGVMTQERSLRVPVAAAQGI